MTAQRQRDEIPTLLVGAQQWLEGQVRQNVAVIDKKRLIA